MSPDYPIGPSADAARERHAARRAEVLEYARFQIAAGRSPRQIATGLGIKLEGLRYMIRNYGDEELQDAILSKYRKRRGNAHRERQRTDEPE